MHLDVKRSSSAKITMLDWRKTEITGEVGELRES